ncbi:MAG: DNA polymerase III subunit alpha, partial [Syntrophobacteraceae bacterium]
LRRSDARAHEVLLCIQTGKTILDEKRMKFHTDQLYFKSPEDMAREFAHVPEALENSWAIAERCNLKLDLGSYHFPVFPVEEGESLDDRFDKTVWKGFAERLELIHRRRPDFSEEDRKEYEERLRYELDVIHKMGFPAYFLIVSDFITYAKSHGIPVGPGRGSGAGSLVAYVMSITDLDPIEHGLIFERFLNLERISMPDIDVDFCIRGREDVFKYVSEKYGKDRVAQIATFGTMQAKAVIRDVGRALAMAYNDVDRIAKLIPAALGMTLEKAFQLEPRLSELQREDPQLRELFEIAFALEGLTRHASTHAAGVVMADRPIVEYTPLYRGQAGEVVTQYAMKYVEKAGLVKFDFLGLRNLTVINDAVNLIRENHGVTLNMQELPLDDAQTYELLSRADTTGVFQLESSGMRDILVRLRPGNFADIVALVALYRPGPLESGMVDSYIQGKHGQIEVTYDIESLRPILEPTFGVILYQEQVMKIASVLANYTLGEADILRRAMGKKTPEVMAEQRARFLAGTKQNGIDNAKANHIFDLMAKFAGYGFNKSHSAAYALVAYQTAYLKTHYTVEFMAALLNSFLSNTDQVVKLINECSEKQIEILPPDVNASSKDFTVVEGKIRFGLCAVKNVGEGAIESVLASKEEQGVYHSLYDFCQRVDMQKVNRRVIEQLIKCGAFDSIHESRSRVLAGLDDALEQAQAMQRDRSSGQMNMFDLLRAKKKAPPRELPDTPDWDSRVTLQYEKEALGFYISGHPLDFYANQVAALCASDTQVVPEKREGAEIVLCGMISIIKELTTKKGDRMAFLALEDKEGIVEVVAFSEAFALARPLLDQDEPLVVFGKVQHDEKGSKLIANNILTLDDAQVQTVDSVRIRLEADRLDREGLTRLRHLLMGHPGDCRTFLHLKVQEKGEAVISLNSKLFVSPTKAFFHDVEQYFGASCAEVSYKACAQ